MANFIVIGAGNDVKCVVDGIAKSHLQHNIVTTGCVEEQEKGLYYNWQSFDYAGKSSSSDSAPIALRDALTNQISHFKTLLPPNTLPNVFIVSRCHTAEHIERLEYLCKELSAILGKVLVGVSVDIVLLGYDLEKHSDVSAQIRPEWTVLKEMKKAQNILGNSTILYLNNMDYNGAATTIDTKLLCKFLSYWAKVVNTNAGQPKNTLGTAKYYSIGMAEYQYDFEDIAQFFELEADARIIERRLNSAPSPTVADMLSRNYFGDIDLSRPWIDGLRHIKGKWEQYCATEYDYSKKLEDQPYSLQQQKKTLVTYLNSYLKLYVERLKEELEAKENELEQREIQAESAQNELDRAMANAPVFDDEEDEENDAYDEKIRVLQKKLNDTKSAKKSFESEISKLESDIERYTFNDVDYVYSSANPSNAISRKQKEQSEKAIESAAKLEDFLSTGDAADLFEEICNELSQEDLASIPPLSPDVVESIGYNAPQVSDANPSATTIEPQSIPPAPPVEEENEGCWGKILSIFGFGEKAEKTSPLSTTNEEQPSVEPTDYTKYWIEAIQALRKTEEVEKWWNTLLAMIDLDKERLKSCRTQMANYELPYNLKSVSLIDMSMVRNYLDNNADCKEYYSALLNEYFDSSAEDKDRRAKETQVEDNVVSRIRKQWKELKWDGRNPFVEENMDDQRVCEIVSRCLEQSVPFVEYVDITKSINKVSLFYSNKPQLDYNPVSFQNTYKVGTSISPNMLDEYINSMTVMQVLAIPDNVKEIRDFKPRRMAELSSSQNNYDSLAREIISKANASTIEEKAKAIYEWLCDNISYDVSLTIHDADTCYKNKCGVCQAYGELFVKLAEVVGLTADMVTGLSKMPDGTVPEEKHSWIFVYTKDYDGFFIDPTWGAGSVVGKVFRREKTMKWFDVSPGWMIYTHYPDNDTCGFDYPKLWKKLDIEVSEEQFRDKLPYREPEEKSDGLFELQKDLAE